MHTANPVVADALVVTAPTLRPSVLGGTTGAPVIQVDPPHSAAVATTAAVLVGYYGAVATYRLGLDPDNHGIPIVTSSLDFLGAVSLILAIVILGLS